MSSLGDLFPEFELEDQTGKVWTLADLVGSPTIVYFYPKDETPGCTMEACDFRDIHKAGSIKVFGVSPDPIEKHKKFADKHSLAFPLLSDPEKSLIGTLGLWNEKKFMGKKYMGTDRTTYVLDDDACISRIYRDVKPIGHAKEVMSHLGLAQ